MNTRTICLWSTLVALWPAAAQAQQQQSGQVQSQNGFGSQTIGGGRFQGGSLIGSDGTGEVTGDAILQRAMSGAGTTLGTSTGSILGGANNTGLGNAGSINSLGTLGAFGMGRAGGGFGGVGGFGGQQFNNQLGNTGNTTSTVRIPIRLGADLRALQTPRMARARLTEFETRLTRLPGLERIGSVQVVMDGRTAIVRGAVASPREGDLIARLLMLEPGVSAVQNDLTVTTPAVTRPLPLP